MEEGTKEFAAVLQLVPASKEDLVEKFGVESNLG